MKNDYFKDIYNDFFSVEKKEIEVEEKDSSEDSVDYKVDDLYLDNESNNLLILILLLKEITLKLSMVLAVFLVKV